MDRRTFLMALARSLPEKFEIETFKIKGYDEETDTYKVFDEEHIELI